MRRKAIIAIVIGAVVLVGGGTILTISLLNGASNDATVKLVDPDGTYDFFSDPSVTKYPEKNALFGSGQSLQFEYDGSKTNKDPNATLSYLLYYIQNDGKVQPVGGGNLNGAGAGQFTTSTKVFNSAVSGASGFFELQGTYNGKNVKLGMYPIKFEIAE